MKDAYYFSHDSNARNDQRIIQLRSDYGMKGYGIFFGIIEILREANGYQLTTNYKAIAYDLREDEEIIKKVIEGYSLFKIIGQNFFSTSLKERMKKLDGIREKRRESGRLGGEANAKQMLEQNDSKIKQVKYSKAKESKGVKTGEAFIKPSVQDIETYCLERKNNINPQSFFDFYESKGWMIGKNRVKNWQACVRTWESRQQFDQSIGNSPGSGSPNGYFDDILNIKQKLKQEAIKNGVQG